MNFGVGACANIDGLWFARATRTHRTRARPCTGLAGARDSCSGARSRCTYSKTRTLPPRCEERFHRRLSGARQRARSALPAGHTPL